MKLTILDYETGQVHVFDLNESEDADHVMLTIQEEDKISSVDNCYWMVTDKLRLTIH